LITPGEKEFARIRQLPIVNSGFPARFSIVLSVFQELVAINAKSFLGWLPLGLHHQDEQKGLVLASKLALHFLIEVQSSVGWVLIFS
jgi:hypothetical protein